jgi:hypothetical protein
VTDERIAALFEGPFCYSRALDPEIRRDLRTRADSEELPFVRGQTVIVENETRPVVLGHPNYLGVFESRHDGPSILLTGRWSALRPTSPEAPIIVSEPALDRNAAERALDGARALRKRLRQIRGIQSAWKPQSPVLIVLLPRVASPVTEVATVSSTVLSYPELPGGIRLEIVGDVSTSDITRYAASLEEAIIREA